MIYLRLFFLFIYIFLGIDVIAQLDSTWTNIYGGNRDDIANDIIKTADNGFLIIGSTGSFGLNNSQMYFLKLDSIGNILWSKTHGGDNQESGESVIETSDGGYLGVGYTSSWGNGGFDLLLVKLDSNGLLEYEDYYGGIDWDFAYDVVELSTNSFIIVGETSSFGAGGTDAWIVKYNANINTFEWDKTIGNLSNEKLTCVTKDFSNHFYAAGSGVKNGRSDTDVFVAKFNLQGDTIWTEFYGDTLTDYANDITVISDSSFGITGVKDMHLDSSLINVLAIDSNKSIVFQDQWGVGYKSAWGNKIMDINENRIAILSTLQYDNHNYDFHFGYSFPYGGYYENGGTLGMDHKEIGASTVYLGSNGYAFTGTTNSYDQNYNSIILFKTDTNGNRMDVNAFKHIINNNNITGLTEKTNDLSGMYYDYRNHNLILKDTHKIHEIRIYNALGQLICRENTSYKSELLLPRNVFSPGLYIVKSVSKNNSINGTLKIYVP